MSEQPVIFHVSDGIASITLNRPASGNAIDLAMANALVDAAIRCETDRSIRCVVLTGTGRLFCAGGDVGGFATAGEGAGAHLSLLAGTLHMAVARFARMPCPMVVLVNGPAAGAGLSLVLAGDIVLAARSAHFTAAYSAIGLTPDGGMSWLLPRLVGLRKAQEIILTNRRIKAEEAEAIGIVTRLVDDEALAGEGAETAGRLAASAVDALGTARRLLQRSFTNGLETQLEDEARGIAEAGAGPESREGIAAFLAKRAPDFRGAGR
ncbi:enoyl-CoA hydratase/isomerase family protein [Sphingopyxis macrogoltabida]|uniref:Enoyl-CoA hydratase n=1 Tax=Sphingopyxis macrogoltabida TaxID=33050 RepID=A0A0N7GSJ6_SPHMC|nr:enoyl-CoA hydratase-related protein [Sphingopyxis macrogoltabida]ALH80899.1 enoyl-CoA hydratase [Sphingopyxis macrogoltabida]